MDSMTAREAALWTPARIDALRLALLIEASQGDRLAFACIIALRPLIHDSATTMTTLSGISAVRCARLGELLRGSGDPALVAFWRRMLARSRKLLVTRAVAAQRRMEVSA